MNIDKYEVAARAEAMPNLTSFFLWIIGAVALCGGVIWLQRYLSEMECYLRGLILPAISFAASLVIVGRTVIFSAPITMQVATFYEMVRENAMGLFGLAVVLLVITNIPTVILFVIYKRVRNKGEDS